MGDEMVVALDLKINSCIAVEVLRGGDRQLGFRSPLDRMS
jgi:hypothetical protein